MIDLGNDVTAVEFVDAAVKHKATIIGASAMITRSISNAGSYASGTGFMNVKDWRKSVIRFRQLNDLTRRIILLEKK